MSRPLSTWCRTDSAAGPLSSSPSVDLYMLFTRPMAGLANIMSPGLRKRGTRRFGARLLRNPSRGAAWALHFVARMLRWRAMATTQDLAGASIGQLVKRFTLFVSAGPDAGTSKTSSGQRLVVGTHESCDVVLHD